MPVTFSPSLGQTQDPTQAPWVNNPNWKGPLPGGGVYNPASIGNYQTPASTAPPVQVGGRYGFLGQPLGGGSVGTTLPGQGSQPGVGAYGGIPTVPNPIASQQQSIQGNLSNLSGLYDLAGGVNQFNTRQAAQQYESNLPNYAANNQIASNNITDNLKGVVSPAAPRGLAHQGIPLLGSPNANAAFLRALGLTSIGLQDKGQQQFSAAVARTPTAPLFQPQSMFVSPDAVQQAQYQANVLANAPNPALAAQNAFQQMLAGLNAGRQAGQRQPAGDAAQRETQNAPVYGMGGGGGYVAPQNPSSPGYGYALGPNGAFGAGNGQTFGIPAGAAPGVDEYGYPIYTAPTQFQSGNQGVDQFGYTPDELNAFYSIEGG